MQHIAEWLEKLGMSEYAGRFAENRIDVSVLRDLTDQDLKDLGVVLGDRRKMLRAIAALDGAAGPAPTAPAPPPVAPVPPPGASAKPRRQQKGKPKCKRLWNTTSLRSDLAWAACRLVMSSPSLRKRSPMPRSKRRGAAGVRYYDTSPWYGLGLCERRFGNFLHTKDRSEYVLSSKVGKLLKASRQNNAKEYFAFTPSPNNLVFDYTADGVMRSVEDSLQRLGVDAFDIVFVHDLSPDNRYLPSHWEEQFEIARKGAFSALTRMREEGIIKGWGLGVNRPEPILKLLDVANPDVCLLASQYSLIDHKNALQHVFPAARAKGVSFVVGSSLNAGFISGSQRYNYGKENYKIPQPIIEKRERLREVAGRHGVDLRTAALQFSATPDIASALVVGAASEQQIVADYSSMQVKIPAEFWAELKERKLIEQDAPVPA
jgi:D-threo-aldose 1-dehydrogenase